MNLFFSEISDEMEDVWRDPVSDSDEQAQEAYWPYEIIETFDLSGKLILRIISPW